VSLAIGNNTAPGSSPGSTGHWMTAANRRIRRLVPWLRGFSVTDILLAFGLAAMMLYATWDGWVDIARIAWKDEEASHVQLVPVVALWLAWVRRARLRQCRPEGRLWAVVGLLIGYGLWFYGFHEQRSSFWHAGTVVLTVSALLVGFGTQLVWRFLPVFGTIIFLVPMPTGLRLAVAQPMQEWTAIVTQSTCEVIGMAVVRQGNLLTINGTEVAVAEACNGMRMVFTLLMVCYAFTFTEPLRTGVRLLILLLSPVVAIAANVVRLVPTVWAYGAYDADVAGKIHDVSGWAMLVVAFLALAGIVRILRWAMIPVSRFNLALS
jgi:exosortase